MQRLLVIFHCFVFTLAACAPATAPARAPTPQLLSVYASPAAQPWLAEIYACAEQAQVVIGLTASPAEADLHLRLGEPAKLEGFAYQLDSADLLVVTQRESPIQNLTMAQARALFAEGQAGVQVWGYAAGDDVQEAFEREVMLGEGVTSTARQAVNPRQMSERLNGEPFAVGILPRRWVTETVREVLTFATVPVLALTERQPQAGLKTLLACLQR